MTCEIRELGAIPEHLKEVVGWEAIAWHTPQWWRFLWEVTELVTITSARLQDGGWYDWLLWTQACAERDPAGSRPVIEMLTKDNCGLLRFTLLAARKN